jgi:hypothetical protein
MGLQYFTRESRPRRRWIMPNFFQLTSLLLSDRIGGSISVPFFVRYEQQDVRTKPINRSQHTYMSLKFSGRHHEES